MKTNNLIVVIVILFSMASCQTSYRMVSRIKRMAACIERCMLMAILLFWRVTGQKTRFCFR